MAEDMGEESVLKTAPWGPAQLQFFFFLLFQHLKNSASFLWPHGF